MVSAPDHCICWNTVARLLPPSRNLHNPRAGLATWTILAPALQSTRKPRARFYEHFARLSDVLYSSSAGLETRSPRDGRLSRSPSLLSIFPHSPLLSRVPVQTIFSNIFSVILRLACVARPLESSSGCLLLYSRLVFPGWLACSYSGLSRVSGSLLSPVSCLTTTVARSSSILAWALWDASASVICPGASESLPVFAAASALVPNLSALDLEGYLLLWLCRALSCAEGRARRAVARILVFVFPVLLLSTTLLSLVYSSFPPFSIILSSPASAVHITVHIARPEYRKQAIVIARWTLYTRRILTDLGMIGNFEIIAAVVRGSTSSR